MPDPATGPDRPDLAETCVLVHEPEPGVVVATLNRARSRNSLTMDTWRSLSAVLDQVEGRGDVRCVVLTGDGPFFSAGGDLKSSPRSGSGPLASVGRLEMAHRVLGRLRALPIPVVAAVEGGAVGLGWSLVMSCDLVIAAEDAFFSAPFVKVGVVPDGGSAWLLTQQIGRHRAAGLLLTGTPLACADAHVWGLVTELVAPGGALARAVELALVMSRQSADVLELSKRLLHAAESTTLAAYLPLELHAAAMTQLGEAADRARNAFAGDRPGQT